MLKGLKLTKSPKPENMDNPENPTLSPIAEKPEPVNSGSTMTLDRNTSTEKAELQPDLNTSSQQTSETSHFDHLIDEAETEHAQQRQAEVSATMITKDQFRQSFIGLHGMAASFSGVQSLALPNSHVNEQTANEVADTIYETIMDVPMMHFILQPGNKWLGRAFVMAVYVQGMRGAIAAEMATRTPQKAQPKKQQSQPTKPADPDSGDLSPDQVAALTGA